MRGNILLIMQIFGEIVHDTSFQSLFSMKGYPIQLGMSIYFIVPKTPAFVFVTIQLPVKVQTATSAILQACIDGEYWELRDPSKK